MKIKKISFDNVVDHKIILINIIGVLVSIENQCLSIDEAEKFLFSPRIIEELRMLDCNNEILDILEEGCLLENFSSILPERLNANIKMLYNRALTLLNKYQSVEDKNWI